MGRVHCQQVRQLRVRACCLLQEALCLCWGAREENGPCQLLCSWRSPPTCSKISINRFSFHLLPTSCFYVASQWVAVSLRARTQLSLALLACPGLNQLTSKSPGRSPAGCTLSGSSAPLVFKTNVMGNCLPVWAPWCEEPFLSPNHACKFLPPGAAPATIPALPNLSDAAF